MINLTLKISTLFFFLLLFHPILAQSNFVLNGNTEMVVSGTSTLHDWKMTSSQAEGKAVMVTENGSLKKVSHIQLKLAAESLKSGTNGLDKNAYGALKTKSHPDIQYEASNLEITGNEILAKGKLTIAGKSVDTVFPVKVKKENNAFVFNGVYSCKLSDFGINPPTVMLGTIKTGDDINLSFQASFAAK
jgi:polyisoprenoid-binding protein YceI